MSSAAEQLASNLSWSNFSKATELKARIWFTLGALLVYRLGTYIPLPGIDPEQLALIFNQQSRGILGQLDLFAGGAVSRMSIFALSIMPYISASIILTLAKAMSPKLDQMSKEGERGRQKFNQYTRYFTVLLAAVQGYAVAVSLMAAGDGNVVITPGIFFIVQTVITLTGGTIFLMWLGEQITQRGVGNGISLIIFAGIVANLPAALGQMFELSADGALHPGILMLVVLIAIAVIVLIVFVERAFRRVLVQYPKRQVGQKQFQDQQQYMPLKLNTAGVIPAIFASSLLLLPQTLATFGENSTSETVLFITTQLGRGQPLFILIFSALIIFFAFFYTAIVFNPVETAENLKKYGGYIPGIRPGKNTAAYLDYILTRLTLVGAIYLAFVCVLPEILIANLNSVSFLFGGTSILIIVSVTIDTVGQIHSHLVAQQYDSLLGGKQGQAKRRDTKAKRRARR
ncbi:MAG: preprotein translocase subunit SecY [Alphaproteobacteria bacterium]